MTRRLTFFLVIFVTLVLGGAVVGTLYVTSRDDLLANAERNLHAVASQAADEASLLFLPAASTVTQLLDAGLPDLTPAEVERLFFAIASHPVRARSQLAGVYVGRVDGSFLHVQSLVPIELNTPEALPPGYDNLFRRIIRRTAPDADDAWFYQSAATQTWVRAQVVPPTYDPRERPWYRNALEQNGPAWSDPYVFVSSGEIGITLAIPVYERSGALWGVIGADIAVSSLSQIILDYRERRIGANGFLFIGDGTGRLIAHAQLLDAIGNARQNPGATITTATDIRNVHRQSGDDLVLFDAIRTTGRIFRAMNNDREIMGIRLPLDAALRIPMFVHVGQPTADVVGDAIALLRRNLAILAGLVVILLTVAVYAAKLRREVTIRKRTESALAQARDVAEEATRAKSSFLAMMSHEIRTPMNGVMSMAEMLDQTDLTEDQRSMSSVIRSSSAALLTIINDILDFSKIEAGKLDLERVPFSLLEVVEGAGELISGRADDKGIGLVIDLDPALPDRLVGDPTRLRQILLNLMGNAVKFTDSGEVVLKVSLTGMTEKTARLRFDVIDTGIGLTAEQKGRLFQAFSQADTSTSRKYGGTGLGLSISQRLCSMMGGAIGVDSAHAEGSDFWFELPLPVEDGAADLPAIDIGDARISLVGFGASEREAIRKLLIGAGIAEPLWLDHWNSRAVGDWQAIIVRAPADGSSLLATADPGFDGSGAQPRMILAATRGLASTLTAADRLGYFATITLPVRRHRLWHAIAAALGRAELNQRHAGAPGDAIGWIAPTVDEARAAGALILVAEDNATNQTVIGRLLNQRGFAHEIAGNGAEALRRFRGGSGYGLLLTDFHMPEMDGFELTREIRRGEESGGQRLPIVALTADALPGTEQQCLKAGMDGYLTKPIDSQALNATLEKFLPQALPLRQRSSSAVWTKAAEGAAKDGDVIDLALLSEIFGGLNDDAWAFLTGFVDDLPRMIGEVSESLAANDRVQARDGAHALKGAARSAGFKRLGQIASDIQDHLDGGDIVAATGLETALRAACDEIRDTLRRLQPVSAKV